MKEEFDTTQENALQAVGAPKRRFMTKRKIIALSIVAVTILLSVLDIFIDPPAWWRFDRQKDKKAILSYAEENYPDAKRLGGQFPLQMPAGPHPFSVMYFELDGINFHVGAEYGCIVDDGYCKARADAQFDKIVNDGFLKPKDITASAYYHYVDSYTETYPYTGTLRVDITVCDQGSTPQEVGWLYDFYKFWAIEGDFLKEYQVNIYIFENNVQKCFIRYNKGSIFTDEENFYSAFRFL